MSYRVGVALVMALLLLSGLARTAHCQTLDATYEVGRVYNYPKTSWILAQAPGLSFCAGPVTVETTLYFDAGQLFEHDLTVSAEKQVKRFTVSTSFSRYAFTNVVLKDYVWNVSLKWRLFGKVDE